MWVAAMTLALGDFFCRVLDPDVRSFRAVISLQQLLGKEDKFFELFEASAAECGRSVKAIRELVEKAPGEGSLDAFVEARRQDKAIHAQISEGICSSIVTALDREDIMALAEALYRIPKTAEKIGERILLAPSFLKGFNLGRQVTQLEQAMTTLETMVHLLRQRVPPAQIRDLNDQLQQVEGDADKLVLEMLKELYASEMEGRRVVYLKDLFQLFEKITDRCRDAGNVILQIVLKNA